MADWGYDRGDFEPGNGPVVLLVEDEMIIAFDMADQLSAAGFQIDGPYPSTVKALAALTVGKPDVAILDVQLTDGDVFPVADRLSELSVPMVFHSGHADPQDIARQYPAAAVCTKPCAVGKLTDAVAAVMRTSV